MTLFKKIIVVGCLLALMVPTFGCEQEGPMEKAGKKMDQIVEDTGDAVEDAADEAGDAVEEAGDSVKKSTE